MDNNLAAGLIVGIVALPLAMAFAIASGAKPEQGIYTAIVAGITVSFFGGIPQGLPPIGFPTPEWSQVIELVGPAFTIAMLGY